MNYQETIEYLFSRLPMYQRQGAAAYKADIGNIIEATKKLGNPHKRFKSIHIAGTNGKGSTAHILASILQESKYKVGLYTSPHLRDFRERIKINNQMISEQDVINFVMKNKELFEKIKLSFFELTVAMSFDYFSSKRVDIAIIEAGLGGRLDSTNIISPEISIITNIGLDHTNLLGNTLEKIANEKAGIIKKKIPVIIGRKQKETTKIFENYAEINQTKLIYASPQKKYPTDLKGQYQQENISTALTCINQLRLKDWKISEDSIAEGVKNITKNTTLYGRWQILNLDPYIICDTAHNEDGIKKVVQQVLEQKYNKLHFVFGAVKDKNINNILSLLPKDAKYYFCQAKIDRAIHSEVIKIKANKIGLKGSNFTSVQKALEAAKNNYLEGDLIFIGGSTFVVAEVL